jgi:malic enzyme
MAAARGIAGAVNKPAKDRIVPDVFDRSVVESIRREVAKAAAE